MQGAPPKSGGNLDIWSSIRPVVLYCKQYKGADTRYRVLWVPGTRYPVPGKAPEMTGSTVREAVHIGEGLYRARKSLYCGVK